MGWESEKPSFYSWSPQESLPFFEKTPFFARSVETSREAVLFVSSSCEANCRGVSGLRLGSGFHLFVFSSFPYSYHLLDLVFSSLDFLIYPERRGRELTWRLAVVHTAFSKCSQL